VLLEVGRVTKAHGLRGEVVVVLVTDRTDRLAVGATLQTPGGGQLVVASSRPFQDRHLVMFDGVTDRAAAEKLAGTRLLAEPVADADALWVHELVGARVVERDGRERGTVVAVEANPAHDLLVLDSGALVPIVFVLGLADGVCTIDPPDGLFDQA
jgi:16S rRNA processing protein RimM